LSAYFYAASFPDLSIFQENESHMEHEQLTAWPYALSMRIGGLLVSLLNVLNFFYFFVRNTLFLVRKQISIYMLLWFFFLIALKSRVCIRLQILV
jgi:hypothetical protein